MRDIVVHRSGCEIDLQAPTAGDERLLRAILARHRTDRGELRCRKHGGDLYLQSRTIGTLACHWPGTGAQPHHVALMSAEHRAQVEYIARAAENEGLTAEPEKALASHVRPDLVVNGTAAIEVQRSYLAVAQAKARTTKAIRGGMTVSLWISDKAAAAAPAWLGKVPSARVYAAEWKLLPAPGAATVESGLSQFIPERCYGGHDSRCLIDSGRCTGWRLRREPVLGVTLDRLSVGMAVGAYVAAEVSGDIHLVEAESADRLGLSWTVPSAATPPPREEPGERIECRSPKVVAVYGDACSGCGRPLWAPVSIGRGYCESCRIGRGELAPLSWVRR